MENLKYFGVSELSVAESIEIEGGAPTNSTSLAYDVAYTVASWWCSITKPNGAWAQPLVDSLMEGSINNSNRGNN